MIFESSPPHLGQRCGSLSKTRFDSRAQPMRGEPARTGSTSSHSARASTSVAACARAGSSCGTTRARGFASGANTPWYRIRCSHGRGTRAAGRCMNSSGLNTRCVVPSRHDVFRLRGARAARSRADPAALSRRVARAHPVRGREVVADRDAAAAPRRLDAAGGRARRPRVPAPERRSHRRPGIGRATACPARGGDRRRPLLDRRAARRSGLGAVAPARRRDARAPSAAANARFRPHIPQATSLRQAATIIPRSHC